MSYSRNFLGGVLLSYMIYYKLLGEICYRYPLLRGDTRSFGYVYIYIYIAESSAAHTASSHALYMGDTVQGLGFRV